MHIELYQFVYKRELIQQFGKKIFTPEIRNDIRAILDREKADFRKWQDFYCRWMKRFLIISLILFLVDGVGYLFFQAIFAFINNPAFPEPLQIALFLMAVILCIAPFVLSAAILYFIAIILLPNNLIFYFKNKRIDKYFFQ